MSFAAALVLVVFQGPAAPEGSPVCLFESQGIAPILDLFQVPPGPRSRETLNLLGAHAHAHGWKALPAQSLAGPPCPGRLLDRIHSAAVAPGVDRLHVFEPPLLAELFARNGRADEAREILARQDPFLQDEGILGRKTEALGTWGDVAFLEGDFERALATYREWDPHGKCGNYWNPPFERRLRMTEASLAKLERWDELVDFAFEAAPRSPIPWTNCRDHLEVEAAIRTLALVGWTDKIAQSSLVAKAGSSTLPPAST